MKRILLVVAATLVVGSLAIANEVSIGATGTVIYGDPTVVLNGGSLSIPGSLIVGEPITATFERTMVLTAPNETHASLYSVTVKMKTSVNNWLGIPALQVSCAAKSMSDVGISTNGSYSILPQTFAADTDGTSYDLVFDFASSAVPTAPGSLSESIFINAFYQ